MSNDDNELVTRLDGLMLAADVEESARRYVIAHWFDGSLRGEVEGDGSGTSLPLALPDQVMERVGGIPCSGHEDVAAGTWTYHRDGECP